MAIVPVPMITTILAIVAIESTIEEVVARRAKIVCMRRQVYYTHVSLSPYIYIYIFIFIFIFMFIYIYIYTYIYR